MDRKELMAKAEGMGLEFKKNISTVALEELIEASEMEAKMATYEMPTEESQAATKAQVVTADKRVNKRKDALLQVRCIITPLDERMRDIPSEMYTVMNKTVGSVKKVVKFGVETLEPAIIVNHLKEKEALIQQKNFINGKEVVKHVQSPAFAINVLPPYTAEELEEFKANGELQ